MEVVDAVEWACVATTLKMTEWVQQWICIKFCIKLDIPLQKLFRWFRRLQLWATGDWQPHHNNMLAHVSCPYSFFCKITNYPGDSAPLQPRFGALWLLAFPKTKITFERKEISDCQWVQENMMSQLMAIGRTVWGPKVPILKETEASLSYVQCVLYLLQ